MFDYVELTEEYSMYEISPRKEWIGKTIKEVNLRANYHVNILGTKQGEKVDFMPPADHVFQCDEHLMVIGRQEDVDRILNTMEK